MQIRIISERIRPILLLPEQTIIEQGKDNEYIWFVANGSLQVAILDNMRRINHCYNKIGNSQFFGEVSIINNVKASATVSTIKYSVCGRIDKKDLTDILLHSPNILSIFKQCSLSYSDMWIQFKINLLKQIDYFKDMEAAYGGSFDEAMLKEIQYYMVERVYPKGVDIAVRGETCPSIIFVVNGLVDLRVDDMFGNVFSLAELRQGDIIG